MEESFKPLSEQISEKMIKGLDEGKSIFHKPMKDDGSSQFQQPFNPKTGLNYKGAAALVLMMNNRRDPRWMSYDQAAFNKTPVKKGVHGTLIEFQSSNKLQPAVDEQGQPVLTKNGNQKMERVKLDEPVTVKAWLFNGKDLKDMPELQTKEQQQSPIERAQAILDSSKAKFEPEDWGTHYDRATDTIHMPGKEEFEKPELYYATALHELAHWTSHETRLNAPQLDHTDADGLFKEELRTNLASIMISAELNLPYDLGEHASNIIPWSQILHDNPAELFKAADDAQKIADYVFALEPKLEIKEEVQQSKAQSTKLLPGDVIPYNGTEYKVLEKLKKAEVLVQDTGTEQKTKINPSHGLYQSLLQARNNPEQERESKQEIGAEPEPELAEKESTSYSRKR